MTINSKEFLKLSQHMITCEIKRRLKAFSGLATRPTQEVIMSQMSEFLKELPDRVAAKLKTKKGKHV